MIEKVLFFSANPVSRGDMRIEEEIREIEKGVNFAVKGKKIIVKKKWATRRMDLEESLKEFLPTIVHFSGHGSRLGALAFECETCESGYELIKPRILAEIFSGFTSSTKCVFLNACFSKRQAKAISRHVNYVIGMKDSIPDNLAITFSISFYDAISRNIDLKTAFYLALASLKMDFSEEGAIPILIENIS